MRHLLITVIIVFPLFAFAAADTTQSPKYGVKLYINSAPGMHYKDIRGGNVNYAFAYTSYVLPSVAVSKRTTKKNMHELELARLEINKLSDKRYDPYTYGPYFPTDGKHQTITNIALRYEYIIALNKKESRLAPAIGLATMPYYAHYRIMPMTTNYYPVRGMYAGLQFAVVPRLNINTNKRLFFDLNVPLTLANGYYESTRVSNPTMPSTVNQISSVNFDLGQFHYMIRLGVGLKI